LEQQVTVVALLLRPPAPFSSCSPIGGGVLDGVQLDHVVTWEIEDCNCYLTNDKETHEAVKLEYKDLI